MENTENQQEKSSHGLTKLAGKYLTFELGKEEYGIGILKVREIIGLMEITAVPHTPPYIKGVINLRGSVIPVLELRAKFNMEAQEYTDRTCIVVVEVQGESGTVMVGMIVDSVSEVLNIAENEIEPPPSFSGSDVENDNFLGMAKIKGKLKILLDVDKVIGQSGLGKLHEIT
ncbi:MAG: chemotaxis protein CheW [Desulfobulbaceae bacterium]|nr:chemotaxis protein CheW [Desulfobulbaceae bacterium]